jgi:hypothetical protein
MNIEFMRLLASPATGRRRVPSSIQFTFFGIQWILLGIFASRTKRILGSFAACAALRFTYIDYSILSAKEKGAVLWILISDRGLTGG